MNRSLASALFAVAAAVAGQAYAAPDFYAPAASVSGTPRAATEVRAEAVQAARLSGTIVGADTLVKPQDVRGTSTANRDVIRLQAVQAANTHTDVLASPQ